MSRNAETGWISEPIGLWNGPCVLAIGVLLKSENWRNCTMLLVTDRLTD